MPKFRKTARKLKHGFKIAGATGSAYLHYFTPLGLAATGIKAARTKSLTLHDSAFIGPGNEIVDASKAKSISDLAARQHDIDYDNYLKSGVRSTDLYFGYSDADKRLMKRADLTHRHGIMAYGGMALKKWIHKTTGLTKRIRDSKIPGLEKTANENTYK